MRFRRHYFVPTGDGETQWVLGQQRKMFSGEPLPEWEPLHLWVLWRSGRFAGTGWMLGSIREHWPIEMGGSL